MQINCRKAILIIWVLAPLAVCAAVYASEPEMASLKGLKALTPTVVLEAGCRELDKDQLKTALMVKLRIAGVAKIMDSSEFDYDPKYHASVWVYAQCVDSVVGDRRVGLAVFVSTDVMQFVRLDREMLAPPEDKLTPRHEVTTWRTSRIFICPIGACSRVMKEFVEYELDQFLNDFLTVNPKGSAAATPQPGTER